MPEAVIVSAARTPIGRQKVNKGSLNRLPPDDLTAFIAKAALTRSPRLDPNDVDDFYLRLRPARRRGRQQHGPHRHLADGLRSPGATITRHCSSSVQTT